MNVIVLLVFVSLVLVAGSISVSQRDYEHADRLSLTPLADDTAPAQAPAPEPSSESPSESPSTIHPESPRS